MKTLKHWFDSSGRGLLWLAGLLALVGCLWRKPIDLHPIFAIVLAAWVELMIVLFRLPSAANRFDARQRGLIDDRISWIPVFLLGFLLPMRDMFVYFLVLAGLETIRFFVSSFFLRRAGRVVPAPLPIRTASIAFPSTDENRTESSGTVLQRLSRIRDPLGNVRLEGVFLIGFDENQETAGLHVPFCPVFERPPRVHAFIAEENGFRVIVHEPRIFGVRIDVKRSVPGVDTVRLCLTVVPETDPHGE